MTDGTSQGLFIVVAIVIFGIFVVLAYILFEDTLSPAMANMFTDAIEQADNRLNNIVSRKEFDMDMITLDNPHGFTLNKDKQSNTILLESTIDHLGGIQIPMEGMIEKNHQYYLEFDMEVISGTVKTLGGHLGITHESKVLINDTQIIAKTSAGLNPHTNDWTFGVVLDEELHTGDKVNVKVSFNATSIVDVQHDHVPIKIQPNRWMDVKPQLGVWTPYKVKITNLTFVEHLGK